MSPEVTQVLFTEELYSLPARTTVVLSEPWQNISDASRALLDKILQAVGLSTAAVTIIQQSSLVVGSLPGQPSRVIFFGNADNAPQFEAVEKGTTKVIYSPPLETLIADAAAKQKLWAGLKVLFSR